MSKRPCFPKESASQETGPSSRIDAKRYTKVCGVSGQLYSRSKKSQAEQEIYTPPGTLRSRSLTRLTMRVGFEHFGQSVLLFVSITFLRSPVFAIFAMLLPSQFHGFKTAD